MSRMEIIFENSVFRNLIAQRAACITAIGANSGNDIDDALYQPQRWQAEMHAAPVHYVLALVMVLSPRSQWYWDLAGLSDGRVLPLPLRLIVSASSVGFQQIFLNEDFIEGCSFSRTAEAAKM